MNLYDNIIQWAILHNDFIHLFRSFFACDSSTLLLNLLLFLATFATFTEYFVHHCD